MIKSFSNRSLSDVLSSKKKVNAVVSPIVGRREHFFNVFDNKYGHLLMLDIVSKVSYDDIRSFYATQQESHYQNILSFVAENDS